jgi:hypothetical protein
MNDPKKSINIIKIAIFCIYPLFSIIFYYLTIDLILNPLIYFITLDVMFILVLFIYRRDNGINDLLIPAILFYINTYMLDQLVCPFTKPSETSFLRLLGLIFLGVAAIVLRPMLFKHWSLNNDNDIIPFNLGFIVLSSFITGLFLSEIEGLVDFIFIPFITYILGWFYIDSLIKLFGKKHVLMKITFFYLIIFLFIGFIYSILFNDIFNLPVSYKGPSLVGATYVVLASVIQAKIASRKMISQ